MFYRSLLAAVAAIALASPVFADDTSTTSTTEGTTMQQSADTSSATDQAGTKIDLNKATAKELMKIKGLNAAKARAIVAYRKKHGEFKSLDELANVKGFKKLNSDTLKEIEDQLTITN